MKGLYPIWRLWYLAYLRWAQAEMSGAHPDMPELVLKLHQLEHS